MNGARPSDLISLSQTGCLVNCNDSSFFFFLIVFDGFFLCVCVPIKIKQLISFHFLSVFFVLSPRFLVFCFKCK